MTTADVLLELNGIFRKVLDVPDTVLRESTTAPDIEDWDSITNVELMVAIEKHFRIRFSSGEILGFGNVGEICACIQAKLPAA